MGIRVNYFLTPFFSESIHFLLAWLPTEYVKITYPSIEIQHSAALKNLNSDAMGDLNLIGHDVQGSFINDLGVFEC